MKSNFFKREVYVGIRRYHQYNKVSIMIKGMFSNKMNSYSQNINTEQIGTLVDYISSTRHNNREVEVVYEYDDNFQFKKFVIPKWAKKEVVRKLETLVDIEKGYSFYI